MITAVFTNGFDHTEVSGLWQWDYGQKFRIQGLNLPPAVEIHFSLQKSGGDSESRVGVTKDGVTDVPIPDSMLENGGTIQNYYIYAFIYMTDENSGKTVKWVQLHVNSRPKPEAFDSPEEAELFREAIAAVNESADRAETAEKSSEAWVHGHEDYPERDEDNAKFYSDKAGKKVEETASILQEVNNLTNQVKENAETVANDKNAVEEFKNKAGESAENAAVSESNAALYENNAKDAQSKAETAQRAVEEAKEQVANDKEEVLIAKIVVEKSEENVAGNKEYVRKAIDNFISLAEDAVDAVNTAGQNQVINIEEAGQAALDNISTGVDETLTQSGKSADAKVTGEKISELKSDIADLATFEKSVNMINPLELKNGSLSNVYDTIIDTLTENLYYKSIILDGIYPKGTKFIINYPFSLSKDCIIQFSQSTRKVTAYYRDLTLREDGLYEFTTTEDNRGIAVVFGSVYKDDFYVALESEYLKNKVIKPYGFKDVYVNDDTVRKESLSDDVIDYIEKPSFIKMDYKEVNLITEIYSNIYVKADGTLATDSNLSCTNYIELEEGKNYYWSSLFKGYYAFYDENKALVEGHGNDGSLTNPITVPNGAKYVRFSMYLSNESKVWVNFKNRKPTNTIRYVLREDIYTNRELHPSPCDYEGSDISAFTSGICIGDSLTEGIFNVNRTESSRTYPTMNYPKYLEKMTGISVTNAGHAGKTSVQWWDSYGSQDFSNHQMAIIQLGVNDYYFIGHDWSDTNKQAFINIINKLKSDNNNIKIFVATIIPAKYYPASDFANISQGIRDLVAELNDPNVILIDIAKYGHTNDEDAYNTGHLSAYGYWRLAKDYASYISWYMHNNPSVFKEIQFIGTDLTSGY